MRPTLLDNVSVAARRRAARARRRRTEGSGARDPSCAIAASCTVDAASGGTGETCGC
jgi:hypothetical protein